MEIYANHPSFVLGFHGCDEEIAENVFSGKADLLSSANDYDWLGPGVYFWEQNPERALQYAQMLKDNPHRTSGKIEKPAVVGAVIDLGYCLNLLDASFLKIVENAYRELRQVYESAGEKLPCNRQDLLLRQLDCAVIRHIHRTRLEQKDEKLRPFDTVRSAFMEGEPLYPDAGFYRENHIQICVCNPDCIKGYFRVRDRPIADEARFS